MFTVYVDDSGTAPDVGERCILTPKWNGHKGDTA
jgi:hypothetical protein